VTSDEAALAAWQAGHRRTTYAQGSVRRGY
jgi:hypothetical protein